MKKAVSESASTRLHPVSAGVLAQPFDAVGVHLIAETQASLVECIGIHPHRVLGGEIGNATSYPRTSTGASLFTEAMLTQTPSNRNNPPSVLFKSCRLIQPGKDATCFFTRSPEVQQLLRLRRCSPSLPQRRQ